MSKFTKESHVLIVIVILILNSVNTVKGQSIGSVTLPQIVYGVNETKTNPLGNPNDTYSSGFYNGYTGTNMPYTSFWHMIINRHYDASTNYQFQITADYWSDNTYFRKIADNIPAPWRRILNDGQDAFAATLNQSLKTTDNVKFGQLSLGVMATTPTGKLVVDGGTDSGIGGKVIISSRSNVYGQLQLINPYNSEAIMSFIANGTAAGTTPTSTAGDSRIWVMGTSLWGSGGNVFGIGNKEYANSHGNNGTIFTVNAAGNVGIGTTTPQAKFHNESGPNTDAAILATSSEGNRLLVKSLTTQPTFSETFRIQHQFYTTNNNNGYIGFNRGGSDSGGFLTFGSNGSERLRIDGNGNVGIGTTNPQNALDVKGTIRATEVKVESVDKFADFVFGADYQLPTLKAVEQHIKEKGHLAEIPSAQEVKENGISLVDMQVKLLQKVEEMTLYIIQQQKEIEALKTKVKSLEK